MTTFIHGWNRFWFSRFDPISLGLSRVFLGMLMVIYYVALIPNWNRFYGPDGARSAYDAVYGFSQQEADWWSVFYWTEEWLPIDVFWYVGFAAAICFTIGWQTRIATVLLWIMENSMLHVFLYAMNGENVLFRMYLFYGMFAPLGYRLSIDSYLQRRVRQKSQQATLDSQQRIKVRTASRSHSPQLPCIWSTRALQIGIALVYFISLPNKLADDVAWYEGDALYLAITSNQWSRFPWPELFYQWDGLLSKIFTYTTILVEGTFPFLVWFEKTRLWVLLPLIGMHLGIALALQNITFFTLSSAAALWVFAPPDLSRKIIGFHGVSQGTR